MVSPSLLALRGRAGRRFARHNISGGAVSRGRILADQDWSMGDLQGPVAATRRGARGRRRDVARMAGVVGALTLLAGCISPGPTPGDKTTTEYQLGYADGCVTGGEYERGFDETVERDDRLFRESPDYAAGWRDGFNSCGTGQEGRFRGPPEFLTDDRFDRGSF
jgi:hypothetical protein